MKTVSITLVALLTAAALTACGSGTSALGDRLPVTPPDPETGVPAAATDLVTFDPVPNGAPTYLGLQDMDGRLRGVIPVAGGATQLKLDVTQLRGFAAGAVRVAPASLIPQGATMTDVTGADARVAVLSLVMFQDANKNSVLDDGELLPRMTHDRLIYTDKAFILSYRTASPEIQSRWNIEGGLTRAEHYVYLPKADDVYRRAMTSAPLAFYLHVPTPLTSQ